MRKIDSKECFSGTPSPVRTHTEVREQLFRIKGIWRPWLMFQFLFTTMQRGMKQPPIYTHQNFNTRGSSPSFGDNSSPISSLSEVCFAVIKTVPVPRKSLLSSVESVVSPILRLSQVLGRTDMVTVRHCLFPSQK